MGDIILKGVTWNHRRAIDPLRGTASMFAERRPDVKIVWDSRPLANLEFTSVEALAGKYDLIVLDHTFCGAIAASRCLVPLDEVAVNHALKFVGPSLASYRYAEKTWAIPIDAAAQIQAVRPDLLAKLGMEVPLRWREVVTLGAVARGQGLWLAAALNGLHGLMTFSSLMANLGSPCAADPEEDFCDPIIARIALSYLRELLRFCPPDVLDWNSIQLHEEMAARDDLVCCPAVYGFAAYSQAGRRRPLAFYEFPSLGSKATALGGTGLGISAHSRNREAAMDYARFVAEAQTQLVFARHGGQPARVETWEDAEADAQFGGFFGRTRANIERAWMRPRYKGYLYFQDEAGSLVEAHLRDGGSADVLIDLLSRMHKHYSHA